MPTYLYLHRENTAGPQERYRGKYPLKHFDYGLSRSVGRSGEIRVVIDGFADATLPSVRMGGEAFEQKR